jgi:hypothetical protein
MDLESWLKAIDWLQHPSKLSETLKQEGIKNINDLLTLNENDVEKLITNSLSSVIKIGERQRFRDQIKLLKSSGM